MIPAAFDYHRPDTVDEVLACFRDGGFDAAAVIGQMVDGTPGLQVDA